MRALRNWAWIIVVLAFLVLGAGTEYGVGWEVSASAAAFIILLILALILWGKSYLREFDLGLDPPKKDDSLEFTIKYMSPLLNERRVIKTSDQVKIRSIVEKLTKKDIKYEIQVKVKE